MSKANTNPKTTQLTTPRDASRVQAASAKANGGKVASGSQASRMQAAAARNFGKSGGK